MQKRLGLPIEFWAAARPFLGGLQIIGGIVTLIFLMRFGNARPTIVSLSLTTGLTAISMFLFGFLRVHAPAE